jgi:starch synthase
MAGKAECKRLAQERFRLEVNPHVPLFSTVSRLYPQKGLDMLAEVFHDWMRTMQVQVLVLGSGQSDLEHLFAYFGRSYPGRVGVHIGYHAQVAHWIKAASDFFIMPSRFEPCGLAQLYAMVYGALPIVRATGGLVDTVQPYDEATGQGTGFVFGEATPRALYDTLGWACSTYYDRPQHFSTMQQRAMRQDFSWEPSVQRYLDVYGWAIEARGKGV